MTAVVPSIAQPPAFASRFPFYYGWVNVVVAAAAMVATLPGRTQGLGLITEGLLKDLALERTAFAQINLWATLLGSLACVGFGRLLDFWGSRKVLTGLAFALGITVLAMGRVETWAGLAVAVTLTRALGQSALSVASLSVTPQWFSRRLAVAMAVYSVVLSAGFMLAFPLVGSVITTVGWRVAWSGIGVALIGGMAPLAWLFLRRSPVACGIDPGDEFPSGSLLNDSEAHLEHLPADYTLRSALGTLAFWVFAAGSTLYGLVASGIGLFNQSILQERGLDASAYHLALAITALAGLGGNFLGGWLAQRGSLPRLMAGAMGLLALGLLALPHLASRAELLGQATLMGLAGGMVSVLFFTVWTRSYGRKHVGQIQGAAQMLTVTGSAVGPLLLARVATAFGSYTIAFYGLALVVAALGIGAWFVRLPRRLLNES